MNLSKCLIASVTTLALSPLLLAQPSPYWSKVNPRPLNYFDNASTAAFNANGEGFVYGSTQSFPEGDGDPGDVNGTRLTKFSSTGAVLWATQLPPVTTLFPSKTIVKPTPDGGAITWADWAGDEFDSFVLTKYGSDGKVQWTKGNYFCFDVASDGSVFATSSDSDIGVITVDKFDTSGNSLMHKEINLANSGFSALRADASGGVWAAGTTYLGNGVSQVILGHIDSAGAFTSSSYPGFNMEPWHIDIDSAGNLIVGGLGPNAADTQFIGLAKMSSAGALQWSHIYSTSVETSFGDRQPIFTIDPSGDAIVGYNSNAAPRPQIMKVSPTGTTLWAHQFAPANSNAFMYGLLSDPDGNLFLLCDEFGNSTFNDNYALIKYFPDGSLGWPLTDGALIFDSGLLDTGAEGNGDHPAGLGRDTNGYLYMGGLALLNNRAGHAVVKYGPANNASIVNQTVPTSMVAGQTYLVTLNASNNGITSWTLGGGYYLRSSNPTDNSVFGKNRADLSGTDNIHPGQGKSFKFSVYAPMTAGNYNFQWRMAQGTSSFGSASHTLSIPVVVKLHAARYMSQTIPSSVKAGSTFTVTVSMKNVGTNAWTKATGYALESTSPDHNTVWTTSAAPLATTDNITRGNNKTFTFTCVAPATPGTYSMIWQMHRQAAAYTGFFGDRSAVKTITVTP